MTNYVNSFQDLEVYKKARILAEAVYEASSKFPSSERYSLTHQIPRSSRSIGGQIAESWAKRRYPKHFVSKLTDADGEQMETLHWLNICEDRSYLTTDSLSHLRSLCVEIGKMLGSMIRKAETFAGGDYHLRDETTSSSEPALLSEN